MSAVAADTLRVAAGERVRLVFFNPGGGLGGGERSLLDLIGALRRLRPEWHYSMIAAAAGPFAEEASACGCDVVTLPLPETLAKIGDSALIGVRSRFDARRVRSALGLLRAVPGTARYLRRLRHTLATLRPHLIHSNGLKGHLLTAWTAPRDVPLIWHIRDYVGPRPVLAPLLKASAFRCSAVIANSRSVAEDARNSLRRRLPIVAAYDAVNLEQFASDGPAADLDALSGLAPPPQPVVRIGMLGTFARWKGHDVLFRALARLPADAPWRAYVIGDAVYETAGSQFDRATLQAMAAAQGLASERLGFTGFVAQPEQVMRALDIVVHASTLPEPFGRVIVEGMACARAVVVSGGGGAAELVIDGENAATFPPGDDAALAERLQRLVRDAALRSRLGSAGQAHSRRFGFSRVAEDVLPLYRSVLGEMVGA